MPDKGSNEPVVRLMPGNRYGLAEDVQMCKDEKVQVFGVAAGLKDRRKGCS